MKRCRLKPKIKAPLARQRAINIQQRKMLMTHKFKILLAVINTELDGNKINMNRSRNIRLIKAQYQKIFVRIYAK